MAKYGRCNDKDNFVKLFNESCSISDLGRKLGYKQKGACMPGGVSKLIREKIEEYGLDVEKIKGQAWAKGLTKYVHDGIKRVSEKISLPWEECFKNGSKIKNQSLLKRLVDSGKREYKCEECGIIDWHGKIIVLNIHHINGKFNDNREENIKILCPNCHSTLNVGKYSKALTIKSIKKNYPQYTKTKQSQKLQSSYRGILNEIKISNEDLLDLVSKQNIIEAGKKLNISGKSVIKLCKMRGIKIPNKSSLQKKFNVSKEEMIELIKTKPIVQIGKELGVSGNAIRKRCKTMGINWEELSPYSLR